LLSSIGDFLPYALRRRLACALGFPPFSLPQGGLQVLGADLNCSESGPVRFPQQLQCAAFTVFQLFLCVMAIAVEIAFSWIDRLA
jgi:hypothetical protein